MAAVLQKQAGVVHVAQGPVAGLGLGLGLGVGEGVGLGDGEATGDGEGEGVAGGGGATPSAVIVTSAQLTNCSTKVPATAVAPQIPGFEPVMGFWPSA